jgi:hypothetical protein
MRPARKPAIAPRRIRFVRVAGFRRRSWWRQPFVVVIHRIEPMELSR